MRAALDDFAMVDHEDLVGRADRAQAVRDHEAGAAFHQPQQGLLDVLLGPGVDAAGGLVEDQDRRVGDRGPGDRQQLALPLAEVAAALGQLVVVARGEAADEAGRRWPARAAASISSSVASSLP